MSLSIEGIHDGSLQCLVSTGSLKSGPLDTKSPACRANTFPCTPVSGEPVTPPSKAGRRSFWDMLVMEGMVKEGNGRDGFRLTACLCAAPALSRYSRFMCLFR